MEKLPIDIYELSPIIISLIEKIQMLDSIFLTKQQKLNITKQMLETVDNFRQFFADASKSDEVQSLDEQAKLFNAQVERAFSQFDWSSNVAVSPYEFRKFSENGKSLISSVLKLLGAKGCGILIIETYLKLCMKIISEMSENSDNINSEGDKTNFKALLEAFFSTANMFKKYWHIAFLPNQKKVIILCLSQTYKGLTFLLKMIEVQNTDIKKYALSILSKCLTRILNAIHNNREKLQLKDFGQEFITLMDFCLHKLNEISNSTNDLYNFIQNSSEIATSLKPVIDELLCYVMSIAQVTCFENDHLAIIRGSQKVLKEFEDLRKEITSENVCQIKLNANSLGEALCSLEQQVNTAVLRLVLEVFSGVNCPLKNIVNKCRTDIEKVNKASEDLNVLVSDFDSEMDKIMQIGFFAISCTSNLNRILKIQSCLASLESLETELIPSLTKLYIDCNANNKANFQHLIEFWLKEITELKLVIDSILDPAGFCGVVHNQVKNLVLSFKNDVSLSNVCLNKAKSDLKQIIRYSRKLIKTLKISMEDETEVDDKTEDYLNKFQMAVQECEAILVLLDKEDMNKVTGRAAKRCDLLLSTLNKLSLHLYYLVSNEMSQLNETEPSEDITLLNLQIPQKNYYKLCDSVEILSTPSDMEILTPYISKGILRSKQRNILYTTLPQNEKEEEDIFDKTLRQTRHWDKTPISRRSRCCKPLNFNLELGNTIDLEITTILENVTDLSNTFSKSFNTGHKKQPKNESNKERPLSKDIACGLEKENEPQKLAYTSSGCCAKLSSEENQTVDVENEENFLGNKFRNRFLQSLNDLSQHASLLAAKENDESSVDLNTTDRLNDLKIVEQRINFLKQQVPCILP